MGLLAHTSLRLAERAGSRRALEGLDGLPMGAPPARPGSPRPWGSRRTSASTRPTCPASAAARSLAARWTSRDWPTRSPRGWTRPASNIPPLPCSWCAEKRTASSRAPRAEALVRTLAQGRLEEIPGAGHTLNFNSPEAVVRLIRRYLYELEARGEALP